MSARGDTAWRRAGTDGSPFVLGGRHLESAGLADEEARFGAQRRSQGVDGREPGRLPAPLLQLADDIHGDARDLGQSLPA